MVKSQFPSISWHFFSVMMFCILYSIVFCYFHTQTVVANLVLCLLLEYSDFISAIADFDLSSGQTMCYLAEKLFIPFQLNDKDQASILGDSDPDLHYHSSFNQLISKCNYFLESSFNENYEKCKCSKNVFPVCHMNIRSMSKNIKEFETYLDLLKHKFTLIGLTETWLKESNCDLNGIKGYHLIEKHRESQGGGVAVALKNIWATLKDQIFLYLKVTWNLFS